MMYIFRLMVWIQILSTKDCAGLDHNRKFSKHVVSYGGAFSVHISTLERHNDGGICSQAMSNDKIRHGMLS